MPLEDLSYSSNTNSVLERMRPMIDDAIQKLRQTAFRDDPIGGRKYSRATSIISSAYKRHGQILDMTLLETLKECAHFRVWRDDEFKLSQESLNALHVHQRIEKCTRIRLEYGDRERTIPVDIIVHDQEKRTLRSYNVKRGNGSYDGGKRRIILGDLLRTHMVLLDYGRKMGIEANVAEARIIFYYGLLSIPKPLALAGDELDVHFGFPVHETIETVNDYFRRQLHALIEEE